LKKARKRLDIPLQDLNYKRGDDSIVGTIGGGRLEANAIRLAMESLTSKQTVMQSFDLTSKDVVAMDMICGGHVSQRIAPLSENVGFRTVVLDDRADYANRHRFPEPTEVRVIESFNKLPNLGIDEDSYLVIVRSEGENTKPKQKSSGSGTCYRILSPDAGA